MRVIRGGGSEKGSKAGPGGRSGVEVRCNGADLGDPGEVRWGGEDDRECSGGVSDWGDGERSRGAASGKSLQSPELR